MNYLTGKAVPVMVGAPRRINVEDAEKPENRAAVRGIRAMLDLMRQAADPVVINILGSCRDVALAGRLGPGLFARKCSAIYLNAGNGTPDPGLVARLEWNVTLDPAAYAGLFDLPCPVYWMPCFEVVRAAPGELFQVGEYGTFYRFQQGDVLPHLSEGVQNFFAYLFKHGGLEVKHQAPDSCRPDWLRYLVGPKDQELLSRVGDMYRNMWCTGGFMHAVGHAVTCDGTIVPLAETTTPVFTFDPIQVRCTADGVTSWHPDPTSHTRFVFHVRDQEKYPAAMTAALRSLLSKLPQDRGTTRAPPATCGWKSAGVQSAPVAMR